MKFPSISPINIPLWPVIRLVMRGVLWLVRT